jgi:Uma2 family endonuclease
MGTQIAIPIEEYLHTSYPGTDREYRDGEVVERSMPDYLHGKCQGILFTFFIALPERLKIYPSVETRVRLSSGRVLIPDVAVFHPTEPAEVPSSPPLVAIEVLSRGDSLNEVRSKLEEYRAWGVPHVWLVDPHSRRFYRCDDRFTEVETLELEEFGISLRSGDVWGSAVRP